MSGSENTSGPAEEEPPRNELVTQLELITAENQRLRASFERAKQTQYRRTALGLAVVGSIAALAGLAVTQAQTVLLALGGTGLFGAVLTYYLTPTTFVAADVGRDVYASLAENERDIVGELGLSDRRVYVPALSESGPARLFVPQFEEYEVPAEETLTGQTFVSEAGPTRGVVLTPSAGQLFEAMETALTGPLAETPVEIGSQLTDALVEQFELVASAEVDHDPEGNRLTVGLDGSVYGPPDQFDHPVVSFLAVGTAVGLDRPVTATVTRTDGSPQYRITLRWGDDSAE